jgi:uncharacterized delta-60 repeat protein
MRELGRNHTRLHDATKRRTPIRRSVGAFTAAALVVLAASLLATVPAQAAPGDLDQGFSGDGKSTTTDFGKQAFGSGVALQADGKIVVAGTSFYTVCEDIWCSSPAEFALARYNADGTLDTSFSGDGKETTDFGGSDYGAYDVAIQPDGKIVAVGHTGTGAHEFAIARYNPDGSLDSSFSGDGKETTDFGDLDYGTDYGAYDVAIQPDGKIVAVGRTGGGDFGLARYSPDGSLDTSFSGDGKATTDLGGLDYGRAVALQADGKIVVAGTTLVGADGDFALARYNPDGTLDSSFSGDGKETPDFGVRHDGEAVALQADGKIVVAGSTQSDDGNFALTRHQTDGSLDTSFSGNGEQTTNFGGRDYGHAVAIRPEGEIVVAGESAVDFALAVYTPDGSLDSSFSADGKQTTDFGASGFGSLDIANDVALQPDGKIVAAGLSDSGFTLARYHGGSEPDTSAPETTISGGPTGTTSDSSPTFSFDSSEPGSTFECRVDGGSFSPCSSPHTTSSLGDGPHAFGVRATDPAGNTDPTPASRSWTIVPDYRSEVLGTVGLVSYWRLGETSGMTAADAHGANNGGYRNGVLLGRPSALLHDANASAGFDGANDYVSVADHASLDTGDRFTLEAWVKRSSSSSSTKTVLSKGSGSWRLSFVNDVLTLTKAGAGTIAKASVSTTDDRFHHLAATKSGATVRLYIDGLERTATVTNRTIANTSTALNIGRYTSGSEYFPGLIDEVAIYNVALTEAQVQRHFKASGR